MKKKLLSILLCCGLAAATLSGCGEEDATIENGTVNIEGTPSTEESANNSTEGTTSNSAEETTEETTEEEPEEEPARDWFEEHGLVITPQGEFTYNKMARDASGEDLQLFPVKANAVITESTDGVEDGYKIVTVTWVGDISAYNEVANADTSWHWVSAFDRYTGVSFEFDATSSFNSYGESSNKEGFVTIVNGDESYDVSIEFGSANNFPYSTDTIAVTCPVDYDGVVFYIGPSSKKMQEENMMIDYGARLYTIDELPAYGDGYYFFSYSNR